MSEFDEKKQGIESENENEIEASAEEIASKAEAVSDEISQEAEQEVAAKAEPEKTEQTEAPQPVQPQQSQSQLPPQAPQGYTHPQNGYYGQYRPPYYPQGGAQPPRPNKTNYVYYGNTSIGNQTPPPSYKPMHSSEKGKKSGKTAFITIICIVSALAVLFTALSLRGGNGVGKEKTTEKLDAPTLATSEVKDDKAEAVTSAQGALDAVGVYNKVKDASVGILVYSANASVAAGEGSGVIIGEGSDGKYTYILTCAHVVANSSSVKVQLADESQYSARVVGSDARTDIAVLRIEKTGLTKMEIGDSEKLTVGETVYAIGNPGGVEFAGSFTNGIVSAIARPINSEIGYEMVCIQHTAAINPGNSGGALVNQYGQLVGINSSKIASASYEGMGFAVPSETIIEVYNEIIANGYVTNRPMLGITYTPVSKSQTFSMLAGASGLPEGSLIIQGISVDSSLNELGVQKNDIIVKANGEELKTYETLQELIEKSKVGDKIQLTICRFDASTYQPEFFDVTATLVEDKGQGVVEQTTEQPQFNPFGNYGYGN